MPLPKGFSPSLRGVIDDQSGKLSQLSSGQANKLIRYALRRAGGWWIGRALPRRYTRYINRPPFNYAVDRDTPLVDSGDQKRISMKRAYVVARATKGGARASVQIKIPGTWYSNMRPKQGGPKGVRSHKTINQILQTLPRIERDRMTKIFAQTLKDELGKANSKTFKTGAKAGQTRLTLTDRQRGLFEG